MTEAILDSDCDRYKSGYRLLLLGRIFEACLQGKDSCILPQTMRRCDSADETECALDPNNEIMGLEFIYSG